MVIMIISFRGRTTTDWDSTEFYFRYSVYLTFVFLLHSAKLKPAWFCSRCSVVSGYSVIKTLRQSPFTTLLSMLHLICRDMMAVSQEVLTKNTKFLSWL